MQTLLTPTYLDKNITPSKLHNKNLSFKSVPLLPIGSTNISPFIRDLVKPGTRTLEHTRDTP